MNYSISLRDFINDQPSTSQENLSHSQSYGCSDEESFESGHTPSPDEQLPICVEQNDTPTVTLETSTLLMTPEKQNTYNLSSSLPNIDSDSTSAFSPDVDSVSEFSFSTDSESVVLGFSDNDTSSSCLDDHSSSFSSSDSFDTISSASETEDNNDAGIPENEYQALTLLSCFLRNQFSASTSKDVIQTIKTMFKHHEDISKLDFGQMMSYVDTTPVREVHYCIKCNTVFPGDKDVFQCQTTNCDGLRYKGVLSNQQSKSRQPNQSFVFSDIRKQLIDLLKTPGIWEDIQTTKAESYERFQSGSTLITDISDGREYQALMKEGGFLDPKTQNITAVFNTDGVNLYSSSKVELWPIFLAVNELSPPKRFCRDNILLVGIWQGKEKTPFNPFFRIFSEDMNSLYNVGVDVQIGDEAYNVKLAIICGIADLPAKAEILNMSYFNGSHACIKCEEPGMTAQQGKGYARCFPYRLQGARYPDRNHADVLVNMENDSARNREKGFKGESGLKHLESYNLVLGTVPDYMHGVLLGVTKSLMNKWFSPSQSGKNYFIGNKLKVISEKMKQMKPPDSIERLPRDLEKHYSHFKATELQSWLLYYAFPCLLGILKDEFLENFLCLSEGVHILLGDCINQQSLKKAIDLLDQFYSAFQNLYGDGSCGLNIHNTSVHLAEYVKLWGPLWAWSCFPFEDANAQLLQAVHGTGLVLKQVMAYRQAQSCIRKRGLALKKKEGWKITYEANNCDVAGMLKSVKLQEMENEVKEQLITVHDSFKLNNLKKMDRIVVNERRFYSENYSRMKKRISSVVLYNQHEIGSVKYFILCDDLTFCIIEKMEKIPPSQLQIRVASHFIPVRCTKTLTVVNVEQLREVLVYLSSSAMNCSFVVRMPNNYGHAVFK
ncbi:uncharacterized protein LOC110451260 [Mizuhopecten yessoensis]|uniref:uncharacterized protein LOC110451260 n=1 Tax=Mizuhopecten yessoensis TaxID=6573 RepID=UPI000B458C1E|nr:uncharacterized protein LOC110451260 [Mizuhopecten yessoensis]